jgi:uncharacterized protein (PEP-CTERM system associated)
MALRRHMEWTPAADVSFGLTTRLGIACVAIICASAADAWADDWQIKPSISAYESFTSNAKLAPPGDEEADFATVVSPGVDIHRDGPRLIFDLGYKLDGIVYAKNSDMDEIRHQLRFDGRGTVVPEMLFLDADAAIAQEPKSSQQPTSGSALTASTNQTSVYAYRVSPFLNNHLGTFADSELRYTFSQVYGNDLPNSTFHSIDGSLVSGSQFPRFVWSLNASGATSTGSRDVTSIFAAASGEYPINRFFGVLGSAGYERISDNTLDDEPNGPIGSVGVRLTPGPRTDVQVQFNHRFDSNFVTGKGSYLIDPQSRITASYSEKIVNSQVTFVDNIGFLERDASGNFIDSRTERLFHLGQTNFGVEDNAFRLRTADLSLHFVRDRYILDGVAYYERRDIDASDETDTAFGANLNWGYQLNELATVYLAARYRRETFDTGTGTDHQQLIGTGLSLVQNLNETLDAVAAVNFTKQLSDNHDDEFNEAVVSLGLVKRF